VTSNNSWQKSNIQQFWSDHGSCGHLLQVYENRRVFIDSLEGFAGTGILSGESIVIVARDSTIHELESRLRMHDFDLDHMMKIGQYIPVNAENALASFMRNGMPDEKRFNLFCNEVLSRAKNHSTHIRIFGEMVVILLEQGQTEATMRLENLWNKVCSREKLCLFCAYPESQMHTHKHGCFDHICSSHTKMIGGWSKPSTEIFHCDIPAPSKVI
jgi:hypothetical protein